MELEQYLQEFEEQKVQEEREIVVVRNPTLDLICRRYEQWLDAQLDCDEALCLINELKYTAKDIRDFSISLKKYEARKYFYRTGMFLSALINNCEEEDFEIMAVHLNEGIENICSNLEKKKVKIIGNVFVAGTNMRSGVLTILGNAEHAGIHMTGGKLIIMGNLDGGGPFFGGEIYVKGDLRFEYHKDSKAKVFHGGELIFNGTK
ncbi:hypothetical protein HY837_06025 [archaeon]|nr:hypothetical protein [archaeon]